MPLQAALALGVVTLGCKRSADPARPVSDAAAEAEAAVPARAVHLAARARSRHTSLRRVGHSVALEAGLFVYVPDADGALRRAGSLGAYSVFLPESDEDLVGYQAASPQTVLVVPQNTGSLTVATYARDFYELREETFVRAEKPPELAPEHIATEEHLVSVLGIPPPIDLPDDVFGNLFRGVPGGSFVAVAHDRKDQHPRTYVQASGESAPHELPLELPYADRDDARCSPVPSSTKDIVLTCDSWKKQDHEERVTLRLQANRWERVPLAGDRGKEPRAMAVAEDGAIWSAREPSPSGPNLEILRTARDGTSERFVLPRPENLPPQPTYASGETLVKTKKGENYRRWATLSIHLEADGGDHRWTTAIAPTGGDAWVLVQEAHGAVTLYRIGSGNAQAPMLIGSEEDQQNEVRNARGVRRWIGHCPQVFVTLASAPVGQPLPVDAWSKREMLANLVGKAMGKKAEYLQRAALTEGRLGDRRAFGVLLWRAVPEVGEAGMEAAAHAIIEAFTDNPVSPPEASCTAPVLERAELL